MRPGSRVLAALLAALLGQAAAPPRALAGEPLHERRGAGVTVRFVPGAEREAEVALRQMPGILSEASARLFSPPPASVDVLIVDAAGFREFAGERRGEWAVAVAFPGRNLVAVNRAKLDLVNDLYTTLMHEAVHLLLGKIEAETGNRIPLWFHEGAAQNLCGRLFAGSREEFLTAAAAGRLIPLGRLDDDFPAEGDAARLAYSQSESFIAFLDRRYPLAIEGTLAAMRRGLPFEEAFAAGVGARLPAAEAQWLDNLAGGPPVLASWLQDNPDLLLVLILAGGGGLLALAWVLVRARRRRALEQLEREDELEGRGDDDGEDEGEEGWGDEDEEPDDDDGWWKGEEEFH